MNVNERMDIYKNRRQNKVSILLGWYDDTVGDWAGLITLQLFVEVEAELTGDTEGPVFIIKKYVKDYNIIQHKMLISSIKYV